MPLSGDDDLDPLVNPTPHLGLLLGEPVGPGAEGLGPEPTDVCPGTRCVLGRCRMGMGPLGTQREDEGVDSLPSPNYVAINEFTSQTSPQEETTVQNPQRLRFVASRYNQLQGLTLIPLGIATILSAVMTRDPQDPFPTLLYLLLWVGAGVAGLLISWYYRRTFGRVRVSSTLDRDMPIIIAFFAGVFVWLGVGVGFGVPLGVILLGIGALCAGFALIDARRYGGLQPLHLTVAVVYAGMGLLSLLGLLPGTASGDATTGSGLNWTLVGLGLAWIVGGILDHLVLVRTLRAGRVSEDVGAV